jgi:LmbE family N-acetylglucosaminyl deacetylase
MLPVLAIYAHPDDECFAGGGLLSELAARGHRVTCVIATGGEVAELDSTHSIEEARASGLAIHERSLDALGVAAWSWLSRPGRWVDHPDGPRLASEDLNVLADAVRTCWRRFNRTS